MVVNPFDFQRIFLVGLRCVGKSTVGRLLAERLGWLHADTDDLVEQFTGRSIAGIFADESEQRFRDLESQALSRCCERDRLVVSTGGGIVLSEGNRELLKNHGWTVWLTASVETLQSRMTADPTTPLRRPALSSQAGLSELVTTAQVRESLYLQVAQFTVSTEGISPAGVVSAILAACGKC